jgi:hypothetical protein
MRTSDPPGIRANVLTATSAMDESERVERRRQPRDWQTEMIGKTTYHQ